MCNCALRPEFFLLVDLRTLLLYFPESRKKVKFIFKSFFFYFICRLNIFCLVKKFFFWRFSLCIFESDTVKSDCPVQILRKMMKYIKIKYRPLVYSLVLLFFLEILKKKALKNKINKKL